MESPAWYMKRLDEINKKLGVIQNHLEEHTGEYVELQGKYELLEAKAYENLSDIAPSTRHDAAKRVARNAMERNGGSWTALFAARRKKEILDRRIKLYDIERSNVQSNLKALVEIEKG